MTLRHTLFGCEIDALTMDQTLERVESLVNSRQPHQHVVVNVNKVVMADKDPEMRKIINNCDLINCDGMPLVWASRLLRRPLPERVAGIDLFTNLVKRAADKGWRVFFLGAREEVVKKIAETFRSRYPDLQIAGYRNGYWSPDEEPEIVNAVATSRPDILFVAISSPRKEQFLERNLEELNVPFAMGVGGSFDVVAGRTKRAPKWMQKIGLEWFYRIVQEPRRMFWRYFIGGINLIRLIGREIVGRKHA